MIKVSIIILSFNTEELLENCIESIYKNSLDINYEIIVVDNNSSDGSVEMVEKKFPKVILVKNKENLGFASGNNSAKKYVNGEYVLFLNSDTIVNRDTIKKSLYYLEQNKDIGALTCKVDLKNGQLDPDTRRSFPTPWVSLTHFSHLDRLFPKSSIFSRYWYGYKDPNEIQYIEVLQGAFCLISKKLLDKIKWFDTDYFLDGEDIDLCWKIREEGYKIVYYPPVSITHFKGASKGKNKIMKRSFAVRKKSVLAGVNSMEIFYKKRMLNNYPPIVNFLVLLGIKIIKLTRYIKLIISK